MSGRASLRTPQKPGDELQELVEKAAEKPVGESARNGGDGNHGNVVAVERRARTAAPPMCLGLTLRPIAHPL